MKILAIETSCDETAVSIILTEGVFPDISVRVLSNVVLSQTKLHVHYGGVFPSLAVREHGRNLVPVLQQALEDAGLLKPASPTSNYSLIRTNKRIVSVMEREAELQAQFLKFVPTIEKPNLDALAVTYGPGLEPALWVGINFAKALALAWDMPLMPINHMEGHVFTAFLNHAENQKTTTYNLKPAIFPALALLISGGHTELALMRDWFAYEIVGETKDDAAGEAFDKVARMLGLPYPGGPEIARLAARFRGTPSITLPRPMIDSGDFNFSFSGLKTAVLYKIKELGEISEDMKTEIAHEFQEAVAEVLALKTVAAAEHYGVKTILVAGGVSANQRIREELTRAINRRPPTADLLFAPKGLTGDNAFMIAVAAAARFARGASAPSPNTITAQGGARLDSLPAI
ncbi:MAG: tRNA (adenosine(37)-N6)-threonylcarbamoyltransferase complex transferase subunit TsaD [Parcubacteria group bacterium]|nr:tRNA (adenosine(37)-N6)-threonylcarbamoyltransferase complex transferase subunit TsaD [Parcubacteria group bacterium]